MAAKKPSLFISEDGQITLASFFLMMTVPLGLGGQWWYCVLFAILGLLSATCNSMESIAMEDKIFIQYDTMEAVDLSDELERIEKSLENMDRNSPEFRRAHTHFLAAMEALVKKYTRSKKRKLHNYHPHEIELICQEAAYGTLRIFGKGDDDEIISSAIALLALCAKDSEVRSRNLYEADVYGLNVPVEAMRLSLSRISKQEQDPTVNEERLSAELQRKGCLLLGALGDGESQLADTIVDEGGLEAILDALNWYRYHEDVANWALWAIFILCLENKRNKKILVTLDGIRLTCQAMTNSPDSLEVNRHGTAILFDVLREVPEEPTDIARLRKMAVGAGLHQVVRRAMDNFGDSMEIMMMGQEMLVATGFVGDIPQYQPLQQASAT